ncbi:hypothetical protein [Amycolatopsis sp. WAC 04197]|uniref:hypothetical protein n=1 Tax=Amycolatopsis sp. WAC 04197 TaxID=2203199 RepID=UPI00131598CC|nr:hypothetical protein [Amycolatopsis sp. WAC 04197]
MNEREVDRRRLGSSGPARDRSTRPRATEDKLPPGVLPGVANVANLQRLAGNKAVTAYLGAKKPGLPVQRDVNKRGTFAGWGGTNDSSVMVNANASVDVADGNRSVSHPAWFLSNATETVEVDPGATGTVLLRLPWYWHHHGIVQELGRVYGTNERHIHAGGGPIDYWVSAPFTVTPEGRVAFVNTTPGGTLGAAGYLEGVPTITSRDGENSGTLTVSVVFRALQTTTTTDTGTRTTTTTLSGSGTGAASPGGVGGSVTTGGSYAVSEANSHAVGVAVSGTASVTCSFAVNIRVRIPPKITKMKTIFYSAEGRFRSGNDGILGVNEWWASLPAPVRELIVSGRKPVRITGRASQTGSPERNERVIAGRIDDVTRRLHNVAGRMEVVPDSEFTVPNERSVVIRVEYTAAEARAGGAGSP